ncbi:hypothetical protein C8D97_103274 [Pleionea mediterranea]|uniref:Uncharacterized protein n=1 Tax=Pleionea mediterranea TaxID=523701 RepID=A0A316GFH6_9GAMM|nr:hypothetical protein C8D97_103274 [Pleionea mediterranea]
MILPGLEVGIDPADLGQVGIPLIVAAVIVLYSSPAN